LWLQGLVRSWSTVELALDGAIKNLKEQEINRNMGENFEKGYPCILQHTLVAIWNLDRDLILDLDWMRS
jgi:hypothetical protein